MPGNYRWMARSPGAPLAALGVLLSVATIVLFLTDLQARYWDRIASCQNEMPQSFATVLAEHAALTFEDVDHALLSRGSDPQNQPVGKASPIPAPPMRPCASCRRSSSILVAVGWTDASGEVVAHPMTIRRHAATSPTWRTSSPSATAPTTSCSLRRPIIRRLTINGSRRRRAGLSNRRRQLRRRRHRAARPVVFQQALSLDRSRQGWIDSAAASRRPDCWRGSRAAERDRKVVCGRPAVERHFCRRRTSGSYEVSEPCRRHAIASPATRRCPACRWSWS